MFDFVNGGEDQIRCYFETLNNDFSISSVLVIDLSDLSSNIRSDITEFGSIHELHIVPLSSLNGSEFIVTYMHVVDDYLAAVWPDNTVDSVSLIVTFVVLFVLCCVISVYLLGCLAIVTLVIVLISTVLGMSVFSIVRNRSKLIKFNQIDSDAIDELVEAEEGDRQNIYKALKDKDRLKKFNDLDEDAIDILHMAEQEGREINFKYIPNIDVFNLEYEDIKYKQSLGEGGSKAVVFLVEWKGIDCAFKLFRLKDVCGTIEESKIFEEELKMVRLATKPPFHPFIIRFFGCCLKMPRVGILTEYCENGEIGEYIFARPGEISLGKKIEWLRQIAHGMNHLHTQEPIIIHRDLKCENVLLDKRLECKIMDFGLSRWVQGALSKHRASQRTGTNLYMAPEYVSTGSYSTKYDVYSYSIMFYMIIEEDFSPFGYPPPFNVELRVASNEDFRPQYTSSSLSLPWMKELGTTCWSHNPNDRMSFSDILDCIQKNNSSKSKLKKGKKEEEGDDEDEKNIKEDWTKKEAKTVVRETEVGGTSGILSFPELVELLSSVTFGHEEIFYGDLRNFREQFGNHKFMEEIEDVLISTDRMIRGHRYNVCLKDVEKYVDSYHDVVTEKLDFLNVAHQNAVNDERSTTDIKVKESMYNCIQFYKDQKMKTESLENEMKPVREELKDLASQKSEVITDIKLRKGEQEVEVEGEGEEDFFEINNFLNAKKSEKPKLSVLLRKRKYLMLLTMNRDSLIEKRITVRIVSKTAGEEFKKHAGLLLSEGYDMLNRPICLRLFFGKVFQDGSELLFVEKVHEVGVETVLRNYVNSKRNLPSFKESQISSSLFTMFRICELMRDFHQLGFCHLNLSLRSFCFIEDPEKRYGGYRLTNLGRLICLHRMLQREVNISKESILLELAGKANGSFFDDVVDYNENLHHDLSPETILKARDTYSLGICIFIVVFHSLPFENWYKNCYLESKIQKFKKENISKVRILKNEKERKMGGEDLWNMVSCVKAAIKETDSVRVEDLLFFGVDINRVPLGEDARSLISKCVTREIKNRVTLVDLVGQLRKLTKEAGVFHVAKRNLLLRQAGKGDDEDQTSSCESDSGSESSSDCSSENDTEKKAIFRRNLEGGDVSSSLREVSEKYKDDPRYRKYMKNVTKYVKHQNDEEFENLEVRFPPMNTIETVVESPHITSSSEQEETTDSDTSSDSCSEETSEKEKDHTHERKGKSRILGIGSLGDVEDAFVEKILKDIKKKHEGEMLRKIMKNVTKHAQHDDDEQFGKLGKVKLNSDSSDSSDSDSESSKASCDETDYESEVKKKQLKSDSSDSSDSDSDSSDASGDETDEEKKQILRQLLEEDVVDDVTKDIERKHGGEKYSKFMKNVSVHVQHQDDESFGRLGGKRKDNLEKSLVHN